jgi:Cdc6-like AAA superfamily ATPase
VKAVKEAAAMSQQGNRGNDLPWLYSMISLNPRSLKDQATLPCIILPPSRSSKFFNRDDVVDKIENHFSQRSSQTFRSIALYGMAGVGKTRVAIKYTQSQFTQRKVSAVFWVEAESKMKVKQSFTDIAARLQLPGYVPHNHKDNRLLVLTWLQNTS